jgi:H+-transporting ATPase
MLPTLLHQVSVSGQALVFVVRHQGWSLVQRAGLATYFAFFAAQLGASLIAIFGFGGYIKPRHRLEDCQFCGLSTGGKVWPSGMLLLFAFVRFKVLDKGVAHSLPARVWCAGAPA